MDPAGAWCSNYFFFFFSKVLGVAMELSDVEPSPVPGQPGAEEPRIGAETTGSKPDIEADADEVAPLLEAAITATVAKLGSAPTR